MIHRKSCQAAAWALAIFGLACPIAPAIGATPVSDYDLLGWFGDALGNGPALLPVGEGSHGFVTVNADGNTRQVLSLPRGNGLRLSVGPLLPLDAFSIAMIVQVENTSSYGKLIDSNNLDSDFGVYTHNTGLRYYTAGQAVSGSFPGEALRQVVLTRSAGGQVTGYLDGVLQFQFDDADNAQLSRISPARVLHFLRDDNQTGNIEESNAVLHRLRLFDVALDADEVLALEASRGELSSIFRSGGFETLP